MTVYRLLDIRELSQLAGIPRPQRQSLCFTLGFEFYGIEFLIGTGKQDFKFKDFKCDSSDCSKTADEVYSQTKIKDYWMDFGIGIVF